MRDRLVELRNDAYAESRRCSRTSRRVDSALWSVLVCVIDAVLEAQLC